MIDLFVVNGFLVVLFIFPFVVIGSLLRKCLNYSRCVADCEEKLKLMESQLTKFKAKAQSWQQKFEKMVADSNQLSSLQEETMFAFKEEELLELASRLEIYISKNSTLSKSLRDARSKYDSMNREIKSLKAEIADLKKLFEDCNAEKELLLKKLEKDETPLLLEDLSASKSKCEVLSALLRRKEVEISDLRKVEKSERATKAQDSKRISKLESDLATSCEKLKTLSAENQMLNREKSSKNSRYISRASGPAFPTLSVDATTNTTQLTSATSSSSSLNSSSVLLHSSLPGTASPLLSTNSPFSTQISAKSSNGSDQNFQNFFSQKKQSPDSNAPYYQQPEIWTNQESNKVLMPPYMHTHQHQQLQSQQTATTLASTQPQGAAFSVNNFSNNHQHQQQQQQRQDNYFTAIPITTSQFPLTTTAKAVSNGNIVNTNSANLQLQQQALFNMQQQQLQLQHPTAFPSKVKSNVILPPSNALQGGMQQQQQHQQQQSNFPCFPPTVQSPSSSFPVVSGINVPFYKKALETAAAAAPVVVASGSDQTNFVSKRTERLMNYFYALLIGHSVIVQLIDGSRYEGMFCYKAPQEFSITLMNSRRLRSSVHDIQSKSCPQPMVRIMSKHIAYLEALNVSNVPSSFNRHDSKPFLTDTEIVFSANAGTTESDGCAAAVRPPAYFQRDLIPWAPDADWSQNAHTDNRLTGCIEDGVCVTAGKWDQFSKQSAAFVFPFGLYSTSLDLGAITQSQFQEASRLSDNISKRLCAMSF